MVVAIDSVRRNPVNVETAFRKNPAFRTKDGYHVLCHSWMLPEGSARQLLDETIGQVVARGQNHIRTAVDFGEMIGHTWIVDTTVHDKIFFAQRSDVQRGRSRIAHERMWEESNLYSVILRAYKEEAAPLLRSSPAIAFYSIEAHWPGPSGEMEPWELPELNKKTLSKSLKKELRQRSRWYWLYHALAALTDPECKEPGLPYIKETITRQIPPEYRVKFSQ